MQLLFLLASHIRSLIMFECSKQQSLNWINSFWISSKSLISARFKFWRKYAKVHINVRYEQEDIVNDIKLFMPYTFPLLYIMIFLDMFHAVGMNLYFIINCDILFIISLPMFTLSLSTKYSNQLWPWMLVMSIVFIVDINTSFFCIIDSK